MKLLLNNIEERKTLEIMHKRFYDEGRDQEADLAEYEALELITIVKVII